MLLSKEELDKSAEIHPDVAEVSALQPRIRDLQCLLYANAKFMSKVPPPNFDDYKGVRDGLRVMTDAIMDLIGPPPPGTKESFHDISMTDGYTSTLKIHKLADNVAGPLIVLCFGGGFIAGDNNQMTPMVCKTMGRRVAFDPRLHVYAT